MQPLALGEPSNTLMLPSSIAEGEIVSKVTSTLGYTLCKWQLDISRVLYLQEQCIVISTAATGAGKTVTFFIPSILEKGDKPAMSFICVPLKDLGQQMADVTLGSPGYGQGLLATGSTRSPTNGMGAMMLIF